jgi:hypothetical protein
MSATDAAPGSSFSGYQATMPAGGATQPGVGVGWGLGVRVGTAVAGATPKRS